LIGGLQCAVVGGAADAEVGSDGGDGLAAGLASAGDVELVGGERGRSSAAATGGGRGA
jgi:hypothetical protein